MKRAILQVEYDGTAYCGYQLQPDQPSIQACLEVALSKLYKQNIRVHASGRTDAGVHARFQIVHFDPPKELKKLNLKAALNSLLPKDIRVINYAYNVDNLHARFDAIERRYEYSILQGTTALDRDRVWQNYQKLDVQEMQKSAELFIGEHDFTAFCSAQAEVDHKRCIIYRSEWKINDNKLIYHISGNRFLHSMVRSLVGTMVEAGKGRITSEDIKNILENRLRNGEAVTAPSQGLVLAEVLYNKNIEWEV